MNQVREASPIVHNITNYVTVNDCANILLACGASPIMADDILEVEEITSICNSIVINLGTLNERTIKSMIVAGKKANELGHPVILDPVGAGASRLRTETALRLLEEIKFSVIRGNASEINTLFSGTSTTKGVDVDAADIITEDKRTEAVNRAKLLSERTSSVIIITGELDIVADATKAYVIRNGHPMMSRITGTGCMLSAVLGAFCAAGSKDILSAAAEGVCAMGSCGEMAYEKVINNKEGTASFKVHMIDCMSRMDTNELSKLAKIEEIC